MSDDKKLPGHERLTLVDKMRAALLPNSPQIDEDTGEVYHPVRRFQEQRIRAHEEAEKEAKIREMAKRPAPKK